MTRIFVIWLLTLIALNTSGQTPDPKVPPSFQLIGRIIDSAGSPLSQATVQYTSGSDTLRTLSANNGAFTFNHLKRRSFRLIITMKGYQDRVQGFHIGDRKTSLLIPDLTLQTHYIDLNPVIIRRIRPITVTEDTVTYHAAAFPVRDGSEVEDILKRLPGLEVDADGNVIVQGKKISKAFVDGKEFFGSDVLLAIQNLPAEVVDKLQVIDDYGDKGRLTGVHSGDPAKVLNIVLKPDKRNGEFGRAEAGGGNLDKYLGDAFANDFRGERQLSARAGISNNSPAGEDLTENGGLNYANQWNPHWGCAIAVIANSQAQHSADSSSQTSYYPGEQLQQIQNNYNGTHNTLTNLDTRLTYKPDSYSLIRLTASGYIQQSNNQVSSQFTALQQDSGYTKSSNGSSLNTGHSAGQMLNSNLYYEKSSPYSRRRFSIDAGIGFNVSDARNNDQSTATVVNDSNSSPSFLHYLTTSDSRSWNWHVNSLYLLPLGKTQFIEMGYRVTSTVSRTDLVTQQPDSVSGVIITIDSLSQHMTLNNVVQNAHAGYTAKFSPIDVTAGLDAQPGIQQGAAGNKGDVASYTYFALLPNLQAAWNFNKTRRLNLAYSSQPTLPSLQQLSPFTNVSNPQYPVTGNPDLKPSYTDNLAIRYEQSSLRPTQFFGFGMGIAYSSISHTIIQNLTTPKDSSQVIQAITYLNAGASNTLTASYHLMLPAILHKHLRLVINSNIGRGQAISMVNSEPFTTRTWTWNQYGHLQLLLPDLVETDLSGNYTLTRASYPANGSLPHIFRSANIRLNSKHYFFHDWILTYQLYQPYNSNGSRLQPAPLTLNASFQRQFLPQNRATISLMVYNLLNSTSATGQFVTPTTLTQNWAALTGRYFMLSFLFKWGKFRS